MNQERYTAFRVRLGAISPAPPEHRSHVGFFLGGLLALILHLAAVEAHSRIVAVRRIKSRLRLNGPDTRSAVRMKRPGWGCVV
jgi:hypothetical protein